MHLSTHLPQTIPTRVGRIIASAAAVVGLAAIPTIGAARPVTEAASPRSHELVRPTHIHLAGGETLREAAPVIRVAEELYTFWNTGDAAYLRRADSPRFHDNTLPSGRPQGRDGILVASRTFRAAVPDLHCEVANLYVTGDTFTAQLVFSGHFTGTLDGHQGTGQRIRFNAIDIQHIGRGGRIVEDWHLEDNLTFLEQAGIVTAP